MAEDDWYAPIKRGLELTAALVGGAGAVVTGLIGYDTGRRFYGPGVPVVSRWTGEIQWFQVAIGLVFLAYGVWRLRARSR